jgi:outer membrane biosynthesis protein TonB
MEDIGVWRLNVVRTSSIPVADEKANRDRRYQLLSLLLHLMLILILALPWMQFPDPPPGQEGILISFGDPEMGGEEASLPEGETRELPEAWEDALLPEATEEEARENEASPPVASEPTPSPVEKPVITDDRSDIQIKKQQEADRKAAEAAKERELATQKAAAERRAEAEAERKRQEEEARKQAEYERSKKQYGDLLGTGSSGDGKKEGQSGDPNAPTGDERLKGISSGAGKVGGDLGGRGVMNAPNIDDRSQKEGVVVIYVCVDRTGSVSSARFTQRGSTTTDQTLVDLALKASRQYRFTASELTTQCGTITFDFKLK